MWIMLSSGSSSLGWVNLRTASDRMRSLVRGVAWHDECLDSRSMTLLGPVLLELGLDDLDYMEITALGSRKVDSGG